MHHLVEPKTSDNKVGATQSWHPSGVSLGGVFYDYLCDADETVVGVRYWLMDQIDLETHPVYRQFLADRRFAFRLGEYLDLVFEESDAARLHDGSLSLSVVQDFGGEQVVARDGQFGITFDVPASLSELG